MDQTLNSPSGTAALNLRSQMLFLNEPREDPVDLVLSTFAWSYKFLHESNHWARYHGSSLGVLLTLLRRSRDALASYFLDTLEASERRRLTEQRQSGNRLFGQPPGAASPLGPNGERLETDWLALHFTYQALLGRADVLAPAGMPRGGQICAIDRALHLTWNTADGRGMLGHAGSHEPHLVSTSADGDAANSSLTMRLLLECAAVLDEIYMNTLGSLREVLDGDLWEMTSHAFEGDYGLAYRTAEQLAGRDLGPDCVLALIDFALNPVVPGLHLGANTVTWDEFHPVRRFTITARSLAHHRSQLERSKPTGETIRAFHAEIEAATGLRMGRVDSELSSATSLSEAAQPAHFSEIIPNMVLAYAQKLHEERTTIRCSIPFFGSNFVGEGALRLVRPDSWWIEGNWWLFPPLRVFSGNYGWPIERINQDEATELFLGAALSSALDDIVYGTGPLTSSHLPGAPLRDEAERMAINRHLEEFTGLPLGWTSLHVET